GALIEIIVRYVSLNCLDFFQVHRPTRPIKSLMERFSTRQAGVILGIAGFALIVLIGRTAYLQTSLREKISSKLDRQSHYTFPMPARRGSIFDATGQLLAGTVQSTTMFVDTKFMIDQYELKPGDSSALEPDLERLSALIDR